MPLKIASAGHPEDKLPEAFEDAWLDCAEAVSYLASIGVPRTRGTLAKWRSIGKQSPPCSYDQGKPRYWRRTLHLWAMTELTKQRAAPVRSRLL